MKTLLYIALIIGVLGGPCLEYLPKGSYYILTASLIFLLCTYLFLLKKNSFVCFLLFGLSINNLADELFFNPTVMQLNELLILPAILIIWFIKERLYGAEINGK